MKHKNIVAFLGLIFSLMLCNLSHAAVNRSNVVGIVVDSITGERLPYVNIYTGKSGRGLLSEEDGSFLIGKGRDIRLSSMGYGVKVINSGFSDTLVIRLAPESYNLSEVIVKPKKQKYSKKNNPAVDLMQALRKNYRNQDPAREPYYSYEEYSKILLALNDYNRNNSKDKDKEKEKEKEGKTNKKKNSRFSFISEYIDTALWTGKQILDISLKEKYSIYFEGKEGSRGQIVEGYRSVGLDEAFNQDNIKAMLEDVLRPVNIYDNDIVMLQNRFVGPLSPIGADFYMYHLTDTVIVGGQPCIELTFAPHNPQTMGFNGKLYVPLEDSVRYIKRVSIRTPKAQNLNYVDNLYISQNYMCDSLGNVHKILDDVSIELSILPSAQGLFVSRENRYTNFSYLPDHPYEKYLRGGADLFEIDESRHRGADYWEEQRLVPLSYAQMQMGSLIAKIRKIPVLYWAEKILTIAVNGYISTGKNSKFDIGPVNTMFGYNSAEGFRMRAGGLTTANLSPNLFARGYVAYGFGDHKWKYSAELEYSFIKKKYHSREFPINSLRATYQYDRDQLGQHYLFTNQDNIFLSLKRMKSDLITYRRLAMMEYNLELRNYLSLMAGYRYETQYATPWITFRNQSGDWSHYNQGAFLFKIRYAPGEKFVQGASQRLPVNMDAPIFTLTHEYGPKGLFGADFTMNKTEFSVRKRFWLSAFGYINLIGKAGILWSQAPFPTLLWQNANLSYTIQPESYTLLNPMEFAMDKYLSWDMEYFGNGILFNRIPLIKRLKLREVITYKGFIGQLSNKNNPLLNPGLYEFPADVNAMPMGKTPYMEIGAGIDNILTILRVDYVWRLTYRKNPGIDRHGLRIALHFSF